MRFFVIFLIISLSRYDFSRGVSVVGGLVDDPITYNLPAVGISVLVRNKAHCLPYFFTCLLNLDYPKDRIYIWIASDHNSDNSIEIIKDWEANYGADYNAVYLHLNESMPEKYPDEVRTTLWSDNRFEHVIELREHALKFAFRRWADYHLMLDADVYLTNPSTLQELIRKNFTIVAPMLISDGLYSNFWGAMTEDFYYKRSEQYTAMVGGETRGCFAVPMVHSAVLVNVRARAAELLAYKPAELETPVDDIILFAASARHYGIEMHVCNDERYGYVQVPAHEGAGAGSAGGEGDEQLLNVKLEAISRGDPIPVNEYLSKWVTYPLPSKLGLSQIYMINLERRGERRRLMRLSFRELGMDVRTVTAVDGSKLDLDKLDELNITLMADYQDPYHKRPMKAGEIGCFLSHYGIWEEIVRLGHSRAMILEDDVHFTPYFRSKLQNLLEEIEHVDWDLVYLGRKILWEGEEEWVTEHATRPRYSYWTLGYLVTQRGASKLLAAAPRDRLLPVDELLPIMFDQHPNVQWKSQFERRDLLALSAAPLLIHPTHYTGQPGYVSDTEDSPVVPFDDLPSFESQRPSSDEL